METEEPTPTAPLVTLSVRLLDADFREGDRTGFEAALAELLAQCEFLLARTAALPILQNDIQGMKARLAEEVGSSEQPHADAYDSTYGSTYNTDPEA